MSSMQPVYSHFLTVDPVVDLAQNGQNLPLFLIVLRKCVLFRRGAVQYRKSGLHPAACLIVIPKDFERARPYDFRAGMRKLQRLFRNTRRGGCAYRAHNPSLHLCTLQVVYPAEAIGIGFSGSGIKSAVDALARRPPIRSKGVSTR
jgi:hypothetical protein